MCRGLGWGLGKGTWCVCVAGMGLEQGSGVERETVVRVGRA